MKQKTNYTDVIMQYLSDDLTESNKVQVEELIEHDEEARNEYLLQVDIQKAFAETNVNDFRNLVSDIIAEENKKAGVVHFIGRSPVLKSFLMAASVTIIAGLLWVFMFKKPNPDRLFIQNYTPNEASYSVRSSKADMTAILVQAFQSYDKEDFRQATLLFDRVLQMDPDNIPATFYQGISDIELLQYLSASENFRKIVAHNDNLYVDKAEWYMGLCYLKLHDVAKAREVFDHISSNGGLYQKEAERLARKLK